MTANTDSKNRSYYNDFAQRYEDKRGENDPGGYHAMLDDLELDFTKSYARGKRVLEAGCGTGLILERLASVAKEAKGFDLSPGMLEKAKARGLDVCEGSITDIPFPDETFDAVVSFKVLAHIPDIRKALSEMARVTKPGGHIIAEFYNKRSLRALVKTYGPAGAISANRTEAEVFTRFDTPEEAATYLPKGCHIVATRGVRIVTPTAHAMRVPLLRQGLVAAEWLLADSPLAQFGGFWIAAIQKMA